MGLSLMPNVAGTSLEMLLPSTRESVHTACATVGEFLRPFGIERSPNVDVVLRELLLNAVVHGNELARERHVRCRVTPLSDHGVEVQIEDEGPGFAHADLCIGRSPVDHPRDRRGYDVICALCERLEFNRLGNVVTAQLALKDVAECQDSGI